MDWYSDISLLNQTDCQDSCLVEGDALLCFDTAAKSNSYSKFQDKGMFLVCALFGRTPHPLPSKVWKHNLERLDFLAMGAVH